MPNLKPSERVEEIRKKIAREMFYEVNSLDDYLSCKKKLLLEPVEELVNILDEQHQEIQELKKEIAELKEKKHCKNCEAALESESKYW